MAMPLDRMASRNGITALAGGGQTGAPMLSERAINRVTTVATAGNSVMLPQAINGAFLVVANAAANSMNVFPYPGNSINAGAANAALAMAAGANAIFFCAVDGVMNAVVSA